MVNVETATVVAFQVANGGSRQITVLDALPGLTLAIVEAALRRSQPDHDSAVNRWLIEQFAAEPS